MGACAMSNTMAARDASWHTPWSSYSTRQVDSQAIKLQRCAQAISAFHLPLPAPLDEWCVRALNNATGARDASWHTLCWVPRRV